MSFLLAILALPALVQDQGESVSFGIIDRGMSSGFQSPLQMFVDTEKDWIELWEKRQGMRAPIKTHPAVDFGKDVVVVAALGLKNTGGYSIEITKIVRTKEAIEVTVRIGSPAAGTTLGGGPTSPFVLFRMKKPDRPVTFKEVEKK